QVVLITGASSGLGEAIAHAFYRAGCRVILASRRIDQLERVKTDLLATKCTVQTFTPEVLQLDLSDLSSIPDFAQKALNLHGCIDILINNGGISFRGEVENTSTDVDLKVMMVNYFGQICLTKALLPSMIKHQSGHILAVSSVQGRISIPHRSAYSASKHALQAFFDCLRAEVKPHGINVTVVSPGYVKTNLSVNAITGSGGRYGVLDETTASGTPPEHLAQKILIAVMHKKEEVIEASLSPRLAILLRYIWPSLYFYIMEKRALKNSKQS
ncbi:hypothetical protein AAG570_000166, partial [Ranatra chinensis]